MENRIAKKVVLLGWSTADWKMVEPLIENGFMPNLKKLLKRSSKGKTTSNDPSLFTSTWNNIITGSTTATHEVGRYLNVEGNKIFPVGTKDRKSRTLWSILSQHDIKCHQVGCLGNHPADQDINGISLSEFYPVSSHNTIYPSAKSDIFDPLRVQPEDIPESELSKFVAETNEHSNNKEVIYKTNLVRKFIAHTKSIYNATEYIIKNEEWEFIGSFFNALMWVNFEFGLSYVNKGKQKNSVIDEHFSNVIPAAFGFLDKYLGRLLDILIEDCHFILVSEGGFKPQEAWINEIKKTGTSKEYNREGILVVNGKHYTTKEKLADATVYDILPTITSLFSLPFSKQYVSSKVIIPPAAITKQLETIDSWGALRLDSKSVAETIDAESLEYGLEVLRLINYLGKEVDIELIKDRQRYFEARVHMSIGKHSEALPIYEDLFRKDMKHTWYAGRLAGCYLGLQKEDEFLEVIEHALDLGEEIPELHLMKANYLVLRQKYRSASKEMEIAGKNVAELKGIHLQIANIYDSIHEIQRAETHFTKELLVTPTPDMHYTVAMFYVKHRKFGKAIIHLKKVLEDIPNHGLTLSHLGFSLYNTKKYKEAGEILEKAKKYTPDAKLQKEIQQKLVDIYANQEKKPEKLQEMQKKYEDSIGASGEITIVSGLPRSGTSMMMQMLKQGGMELFTDGKREADENNQKGYYEHEAVKTLAKDKKFLFEIEDKAIKIISHLLHHLPHIYNYKIIFMDREIEEVMHSQHKMLGRLGKERGESEENSLKLQKPFAKSRKNAMQWCKRQKKYVDLLIVPYGEVIVDPLDQAKKINEFLGGQLDTQKMAAVVDPSLHREKV